MSGFMRAEVDASFSPRFSSGVLLGRHKSTLAVLIRATLQFAS